MATMSKAFQIFDGNIRGMKQHLQLMDASLVNADKICRNIARGKTVKTIANALKSSEDYPQLNIPCKPIDIGRTFKTARTKIHEQAIVDLYRYFSYYLLNLIEEFIKSDPMPLLDSVAKNKDNTLTFSEILTNNNNKSELIRLMAGKIFRRFESERSTKGLLDKIKAYSKIDIDESKALVYLEIRHLIIHRNSKIDQHFAEIDTTGLVPIVNGKVKMDYALSSNAIITVYELCQEIDRKLLEKGMITSAYKTR